MKRHFIADYLLKMNRRCSKGLAMLTASMMSVFLLAGHAVETKEINFEDFEPGIAGADYVKDLNECYECHDDYMDAFKHTTHDRVFSFRPKDVERGTSCELCHGPLGNHLKLPKKKEYVISLKADSPLTPQQRSSICLQCHEKGARIYWKGAAHEAMGVSCSSCHYVAERRSDKSLLINEDEKKACFKCHSEKRAQMQRSSHMPLREGKVACSDCHNPHGSFGPKLLVTATVNETCYTCHAEKRGPFIWEHAPVNENCLNCHDPHGSNNPGLLIARNQFLCIGCHSYGGHSTVPGAQTTSATVASGCINCHSRIHGSNHPSGARFQR